jgi:hypothetical protein
VVVAADRRRAWTEVAAESTRSGIGCQNTARLYVDGRLVYTAERNEENGTAVTMAPVGWSPDDRKLLLALFQADYASDHFGLIPLLYDSETGRTTEPKIVDPIAALAPSKCEFDLVKLVGFDKRGRIVVELVDSVDIVDGEPTRPCGFGKGKKFALDPATDTAVAVP